MRTYSFTEAAGASVQEPLSHQALPSITVALAAVQELCLPLDTSSPSPITAFLFVRKDTIVCISCCLLGICCVYFCSFQEAGEALEAPSHWSCPANPWESDEASLSLCWCYLPSQGWRDFKHCCLCPQDQAVHSKQLLLQALLGLPSLDIIWVITQSSWDTHVAHKVHSPVSSFPSKSFWEQTPRFLTPNHVFFLNRSLSSHTELELLSKKNYYLRILSKPK